MRAPHQCLGAQGGILALHHWVTVLQGHHVLMAYIMFCSLHKKTGTHSGSGFVSVATDSGHNSKSQTHSSLPKCDSRPVVSAEPAHHDRVESPPRSRESDIQTVGNSSSGHVCHSPQHASSPVHVSSSGALSTGDRCLVTGLAGEVDVHVSTISPAQQSHSEAQDHPDGRGDTHHPLVAVTTVVSTPATTECGSSPTILSAPHRPVVTTGLYLKQQVVPSARMEALMQHYQAAGLLKEVSTVPLKNFFTDRMCYNLDNTPLISG